MNQILQVTQDFRQTRTLVLGDGTQLTFSLYFVPMQQCWVIPEIVYGDFRLTNIKVVNSPNLLHQWRNQIPFGLACFTIGNREPSLQEDFSSNNSRLFLLPNADVVAFTESLIA